MPRCTCSAIHVTVGHPGVRVARSDAESSVPGEHGQVFKIVEDLSNNAVRHNGHAANAVPVADQFRQCRLRQHSDKLNQELALSVAGQHPVRPIHHQSAAAIGKKTASRHHHQVMLKVECSLIQRSPAENRRAAPVPGTIPRSCGPLATTVAGPKSVASVSQGKIWPSECRRTLACRAAQGIPKIFPLVDLNCPRPGWKEAQN